jgi:hypothetical protein
MARPGRGWRLGGSAFAVLVLVWSGWEAVDQLTSRDESQTDRFASSDVDAIVVQVDNGDVFVSGRAGTSEVVVRASLRVGIADPTYTLDVRRRTLHISATCGEVSDNCLRSLRLSVPRGVDLTLRSDNGDIVTEALVSSTVDATSDNGDVGLEFSEAPDEVVARSDNGDVSVMLSRATDVNGIDFALTASSENGDVTIPIRTNPSSARSIQALSDNGDVTVAYQP